MSRLLAAARLPVFIDEVLAIDLARTQPWYELLGLGKYLSSEVIGLFSRLPFDPVLAARQSAILCGCAALLLLIRLGREVHGQALGHVAGTLYVITPYALFYNAFVLADSFLPAFVAGAMLLSLRLARRPGALTLLALSFLLPIAALFEFSSLRSFCQASPCSPCSPCLLPRSGERARCAASCPWASHLQCSRRNGP